MPVMDCPVSKQDWVHIVGERNGVSDPLRKDPGKKTLADAGPWEPAVQKVLGFQHLAADWDGFGAAAPSHELLESAIGLAYCLFERGVDPPQCVVAGVNGSVTFEWQYPDGTYVDVEIVRSFHAEVMMIEPGKPARHWTLPTE